MARKKLYNQAMGGTMHLRLPTDLENRFLRICVRKKMNKSEGYRLAIEAYCDQVEGKTTAAEEHKASADVGVPFTPASG